MSDLKLNEMSDAAFLAEYVRASKECGDAVNLELAMLQHLPLEQANRMQSVTTSFLDVIDAMRAEIDVRRRKAAHRHTELLQLDARAGKSPERV